MIPLEKHIKSSLNNAGLLPPSSRSSGSEMASFLCSGKSSVTLLRFSRVPALSLSRFQSHRVALSSFDVKPLAVTLALGRLRLALQRTAPLRAGGLTRTELPWLQARPRNGSTSPRPLQLQSHAIWMLLCFSALCCASIFVGQLPLIFVKCHLSLSLADKDCNTTKHLRCCLSRS